MALLVHQQRNYLKRWKPKKDNDMIVTKAMSLALAESVLSHCTIPTELRQFFLEYLSNSYLINKKLYKKHFSMYNSDHE